MVARLTPAVLALVVAWTVGLESRPVAVVVLTAGVAVFTLSPVDRSPSGELVWLVPTAWAHALAVLLLDPAAAIVAVVLGGALGEVLMPRVLPQQASVPLAARIQNVSRTAVGAQVYWLMPVLTSVLPGGVRSAALVVVVLDAVVLSAVLVLVEGYGRSSGTGWRHPFAVDVGVDVVLGAAALLTTIGHDPASTTPLSLVVVPALAVLAVSQRLLHLRDGADRGRLLGAAASQLADPPDGDAVDVALVELLAGLDPTGAPRLEAEPSTGREVVAVLGDGRVLTRDGDRELGAQVHPLVRMLVELTDRVRASVAVRQHETRTMAWRGDVLAALAHDIAQPLAAARSAAETMLALAPDDDRLALAAGVLERQLVVSQQIVRDLLEVARLDDAGASTFEEVDVVAACRAAVDGVVVRREVAVEVHGAGVAAFSMRVPLERTIANLVQNAIRHSPRGGTVRVSAARTSTGVVVHVDDAGEGIDPAVRDHVLGPFASGDPSGVRSGLGLHLVTRFVEHLGGELDVDESPAGGARLTVRLPEPTTDT